MNAEHVTRGISFNLSNNWVEQFHLFPFYRCGNQGLVSLGNLLRVIQIVQG